MYHVLLVDDEDLDLRGLEHLVPWHEYHMEVVAAVKSGFEALDILRQQAVDVLVTDIRMPNMTGLELAVQAKALHPRLKVLFISGYQDFQYARRAIEMHVSGYVLKPIDDDEFFLQVQHVHEQLEEEEERTRVDALLHQSLPLAQEQILLQWLEGSVSEEKAQPFLHLSATEGVMMVALIEVDDIAWKLREQPDEKRKAILQTTIQTITDFLEARACGLFCRTSPQAVMVLLHRWDEPVQQTLDELIEQVQSTTSLSITIGLGLPVQTLRDAPISYQEAKKALASKMFLGKGKQITLPQTHNALGHYIDNLDQQCILLFQTMVNNDTPQIRAILDGLFSQVAQLNSRSSIYNFALYLLSRLDSYLSTMHERLEALLGVSLLSLDILYAFETVDDMKHWFQQSISFIAAHLQQKQSRPNRRLFEHIEQYVEEHINQNVTLREVANHLGFSPNYLGSLFKEEVGEHFTEYVNRKKLEKAVRLLQNPRLKIHEIAEQLGYNSLTYFGRQFKDVFGQTPGDFRKRL